MFDENRKYSVVNAVKVLTVICLKKICLMKRENTQTITLLIDNCYLPLKEMFDENGKYSEINAVNR